MFVTVAHAVNFFMQPDFFHILEETAVLAITKCVRKWGLIFHVQKNIPDCLMVFDFFEGPVSPNSMKCTLP